jgi:hypothetical protein
MQGFSQKLENSEDTAIREAFLEAVANGSAVSWQHINLLGVISQTKSCRIRWESNPQNWRTKGRHFWEPQKEQNSQAGTALDKILFRIWYLGI